MFTRSKYDEAVGLHASGDVEGAKNLLLEIYNNTRDTNLKIDSAVSLISCLNQADDHQLMLQVCNEGIKQSRAQNRKDALVLLLMRRATTLLQKLSLIVWAQKNITLMDTWFQFAHEKEQEDYQHLQKLFEQHKKNALDSIDEAMSLPMDESVKFHVIFDSAHAKEQLAETLNFSSVHHKKFLGRIWKKVINRDQYRLSCHFLKEARSLYHKAIEAGLASGDETAPGYCYYQLGLSYRMYFKFWRSRYYLMLAKQGAKKYKINSISRSVDEIFADFHMRKIGGDTVNHHDITID